MYFILCYWYKIYEPKHFLMTELQVQQVSTLGQQAQLYDYSTKEILYFAFF